jgi:hypothetical protein
MPHFSRCWRPSPLQAHWGSWLHSHLLWPACLFTVRMGECPFPPLHWSFPHDSHCYKLSPLQVCWVGVSAPAFSGQLVYLQFVWGIAPPPSLVEPSTGQPLLQAFPTSRLLGRVATPAFSDWLVYLQFVWGSAPPPFSRAQGTPPSLICVFFFSAACLLFRVFFLFSLGRGQSVQGAMLICSREYRVPLICSPGGLQRHIPSVSAIVYFRKHAFCFLPLVTILESSLSKL